MSKFDPAVTLRQTVDFIKEASRDPQSVRPLTETQRHGEKGVMVGRGLRTRRSEGLDRINKMNRMGTGGAR